MDRLKRGTKILIYGEWKSPREWAEEAGITYDVFYMRYRCGIRGEALVAPVSPDHLVNYEDVYELWGKWIFTGKKIEKPKWKGNAHWVYVGRTEDRE